MISLYWTDVSSAARCELWTWCVAVMTETIRRYLERPANVAKMGIKCGRRLVHPKCVNLAHFHRGTP